MLLVKRGKEPFKGYWAFPGGGQALGERLEETARRELAEETALTARHLEFLGFADRIAHGEDGIITHHHVLARFLCTAFDGEPRAGGDAHELRWVSLAEAATLDTVPHLLELIGGALERARAGRQAFTKR